MNKNVSVGLDIGSRHINIVKLASVPQGWKLLDFASSNLNISQGKEKEERLRRLEKIVQEKEIAASAVNVGISGESVIVRYIDLPKMSEEEISQALKYEAQQYIPFKMEEVVLDYHILGPHDAGANRIKILLAAAKRESVTELIELIQKAALKPNLIDVDAFSLINCFQKNGPKMKEDDVFALINLKFDLVNIDILQCERPFFTRDISFVENTFSLQPEGEERGLFETVRPLLANLIREIQVSIDYFESEFGKQVRVIYLSGEGTKVPELITFFNNQLGREIILWNPVENLIIDSTQIDIEALKNASSMLALACGLALRGAK